MTWPPPRFYQALLEDWTLTDASAIVSSTADQTDGTCDIVTNGIAGTFYYTTPISDFFGGPIDTVGGMAFLQAFGAMISSANNFDYVRVGFRDSTTGEQVLFGIRTNGDVFTTAWGSGTGASAIGADITIGHVSAGGNEIARYVYGDGYSAAGAYLGTRAATVAVRTPCNIDELVVYVSNNGANAQTFTIEAGFYVAPSIPDINAIAARL